MKANWSGEFVVVCGVAAFLTGLSNADEARGSVKRSSEANDETPESIVNAINKMNSTWKAKVPKFLLPSSKYLAGTMYNDTDGRNGENSLPYKDASSSMFQEFPESFDARERWGNCPSLFEIRNQGTCGSCWAKAAASAISDRICIHSGATYSTRISAQHLLDCCTISHGCDGGYPFSAWKYWQTSGLVSGGPYGSMKGCLPYEVPTFSWGENPYADYYFRKCTRQCKINRSFQDDLHYGESAYRIHGDQGSIMREIIENGPVETDFFLYLDFLYYDSGEFASNRLLILRFLEQVSTSTSEGPSKGKHAIKLIGWGVENNTPYWLAANSWSKRWGEKGFVKFLRGYNHCDIESNVVAGIPETRFRGKSSTVAPIKKTSATFTSSHPPNTHVPWVY